MPRGQSGSIRKRAELASVLALVFSICLAGVAYACEIPVYHYALENWEADVYEVTVFHRGELSDSDRNAVSLLREAADYRGGSGNLTVQTVDLAANPDAIMLQRWRDQAGTELPWMAASYPQHTRIREPAWAGPLSKANVRALLDSPLRRKIAGELTSRVTAAWVLLESGDRGKDNAAAALLERELKRLEQTLVLPELEGWGPDAGTTEADDVRFTMHRLSRDSKEERMFVNMLLRSEGDLVPKFDREPLVFPMYGRGLILYALAGAGINEWTIMKAAEFVTGPCSCEVKADNPGTDMLLTLDWDAHVKQTAQERMPPPTGMASFQDRAAEAERRLAEVDEAQGLTGAGSSGEVAEPSAAARGAGASSTPVRSTAPRTLETERTASPRTVANEGTAPPDEPAAAREDTPSAETAEASPTEQGEAPGAEAGGPAEEREDVAPEVDEDGRLAEDFDDPAAVAQLDGGSDGGSEGDGVARLVGLLALIAAAITSVLAAVVIMRRRRRAVRDGEHERIPT